MATLTTHGISITAESQYQGQFSEPVRDQYVFSYRIKVENNSSQPIQLMTRRWEVMDATGERRFVEGKGVVGQQPIILPGHSYEYNSWVQLETSMGAMQGSYIMARKDSREREQLFEVFVPRFQHIAPEVLN